MAKNKKGFMLYADQRELFSQLPDELAGKLIKHIFGYVNDETPISNDALMNMAFTPIRLQLKRDLVKWNETKEKRSLAGKESARIRALEKQHNSTKPTSVESVQHNSTKPTVSVNVNENVKDTVKVIKEEVLIFPFDSDNFKIIWNLWKQYKKEQHNFTYKSNLSEQAALKKLSNLANGNEDTACKIIEESISQGYKGLFELKNNFNEKNRSNNKGGFKSDTTKEAIRAVANGFVDYTPET